MSDHTPTPNLDDLERIALAATPGPYHAESQHYRNHQTGASGTHWWISGPDRTPLTTTEGVALHFAAFDRETCMWLVAEARDAARMRVSVRETEDQLIKVANHFGAKCGDGLPHGSGDTLADAVIRKADAERAKVATLAAACRKVYDGIGYQTPGNVPMSAAEARDVLMAAINGVS